MKNKKGISLIVLVITIIVIIILAAAVILTLTDNNPISNSKAAAIAQNKDSVESAINLYVAQKIAATQGTFTNTQIVNGTALAVSGSLDPILLAGTASMKITTGNATTASAGAITNLFALDTTPAFKTAVGLALPTPPAGSAWYIDPAANKVYLVFAAAVPTWLASANLSFVVTAL